jgi:3-deoxy-D-manno-octulosonic-acid transferase
VIFGPRSSGSRDAGLLMTQGGGAQVDSAAALAALIEEWLANPGKRADIGARARGMVANGLGAARATYELVRALLPG